MSALSRECTETVAVWLMNRAATASRRAVEAEKDGNLHYAAMDQATAAALYSAAADLRDGKLAGAESDMLITLDLQGSYTDTLKKRMRGAAVNATALAEESGISVSQISRWFTTPLEPQMANVKKLEEAFASILAARTGRKKKQ